MHERKEFIMFPMNDMNDGRGSERPGRQGPRRGGPHGRGRGHSGRGHGGRGFGGPGFGGSGFGGPGFGGPGFGPRGRGRARRGDIRLAILGLLSDGPNNGYGLIKAIGERTEGIWTPSPGSVYPTLQQLVEEGLITTIEGEDGQFTLTPDGRNVVEENAEQIARVWAPMEQMGDHHAYLTASRKLAGVLRQLGREGTSAQREAAVTKIDQLRKELYLILAED